MHLHLLPRMGVPLRLIFEFDLVIDPLNTFMKVEVEKVEPFLSYYTDRPSPEA